MKWVVNYFDGKQVDEDMLGFLSVDKNKIQSIYFIDIYKKTYGIDFLKKTFYINNNVFDLKILGDVTDVFQYKNASYNFYTCENKINSWNIGFDILTNQSEEKYILTIYADGSVFINCFQNNQGNKRNKKTLWFFVF